MSIYTALAIGATIGFVSGFGEGLSKEWPGQKVLGNAISDAVGCSVVALIIWAIFA